MTLVVARYQEDVSWTESFKDVFIVQKGEHYPNIGREPSSFLWYILQHYDQLEGNYAFVQGNPFPHSPDLQNCIDYFETTSLREQGFWWLAEPKYTSNATGHPFDNCPVGKVAEELGLKPEYPIRFVAGGQFIVTAERIKARPRSWYDDALSIMLRHHRGEYCFERLWEEIFKVQNE